MLKARYCKYTLHFRRPSGTSRGVMHHKDSWFLQVDNTATGHSGTGECGLLAGLSMDDPATYEAKLKEVCSRIDEGEALLPALQEYPSIRFGLEMALADLGNGGRHILFPSPFTEGERPIPINGLIWMGTADYMKEQVRQKLEAGYRCIKMKIGAIGFEEELAILKSIRQEFSPEVVELRVDANGAFTPAEASDKLARLAELGLHSIEQPIRAGQWQEMATLCEKSPLPIALDEELIGVYDAGQQEELMATIRPQFLILKPSLLGGFAASQRWVALAEKHGAGWWVTSALESNIGLNAIAQWTATLGNPMPQGLGTGQLYTNNFPSPLEVQDGMLHYREGAEWELQTLNDAC